MAINLFLWARNHKVGFRATKLSQCLKIKFNQLITQTVSIVIQILSKTLLFKLIQTKCPKEDLEEAYQTTEFDLVLAFNH